MRIIASGGNRLHAPANSLAALISGYTGGADALLIGVRQTADGVLVPAGDDRVPGSEVLISASSFAALQAYDFSAGWLPRRTEASFHYCDPAVSGRRLKLPRLDDVIDALPRDVTLLIDAGAFAEAAVALLESRGRIETAMLVSDSPAALAAARPGLRTALWATDGMVAASDVDLLIVPVGALRDGGGWSQAGIALRERKLAGEWPMGLCAVLDDAGTDPATLDALAQTAWLWGVCTGSTFDMERLRPGYVHSQSDFAGTEIDRRQFALGYAKANRFANVHCDDGVHLEIADYAGPMPGGGGSPTERRITRLEWDLINVAKEWPFYSGGGLGTVRGIGDDFAAEVAYRVARVGQATTLEMAVTNVDPGAHRAAPPQSFRDKDSFYDPHGAPPYVGVEHDEDDGFRINWNLGCEYDNNQYGRPVSEGRTPHGGRLRLERRGAFHAAYFRDPVDADDNPLAPRDWVCVGVVANESLNRTVYLRCVGKRWRQEKESDPSQHEPILPNHFVFRDLRITCFPPASRG
ncbi:glycerophosphodiester phosphodiesterase [Sphingomonas psychrotolerans]|nr:hypothetical protein [Sphingomonas psychrotolerans]